MLKQNFINIIAAQISGKNQASLATLLNSTTSDAKGKHQQTIHGVPFLHSPLIHL